MAVSDFFAPPWIWMACLLLPVLAVIVVHLLALHHHTVRSRQALAQALSQHNATRTALVLAWRERLGSQPGQAAWGAPVMAASTIAAQDWCWMPSLEVLINTEQEWMAAISHHPRLDSLPQGRQQWQADQMVLAHQAHRVHVAARTYNQLWMVPAGPWWAKWRHLELAPAWPQASPAQQS